LLGMGLVNATNMSRLVLEQFDVAALVVSGVAGSCHDIGDVRVPTTWTDAEGNAYPTDPALMDIARSVAPSVPLERCTPVPPNPPGPSTCILEQPVVLLGGTGRSSDPAEVAIACAPGGDDDILSCDIGGDPTRIACIGAAAVPACAPDQPDPADMETTAVAREAQARGVPFIAFRAVSDGAGDPLDLGGYPCQFFAYYELAAHNAAATTEAFVKRWGMGRRAQPATRSHKTVVRASCDWDRHAAPARTGHRSARAPLTSWVTRACRLLARDDADADAVDHAWDHAARVAARPAIRQRLGRPCAGDLAAALGARAAE